MLHDAGLVALPREDWGKPVPRMRRNLYMHILRTPHNVRYEPQAEYVRDWGRYKILANGELGGAADDALTALDRAGARGAAALGAGAGFLFGTNRLMSALMGGVVGYFGGAYIANLLRKAIILVPAAATTAAAKATTP